MLPLRLLGPVDVRDPSGAPVPVGRRKQRELLGLFVLRAGEVLGADELVDALWCGRPPASARANLHSYVSNLRTVSVRAVPGSAVRPRTVRGGYRFELAAGECDVTVFDELAAAGRRALAADRPARAVELLTRALGLWRGSLLEDLGAPAWAQPYDARLGEARLRATEDQVEARLVLGQHDELSAELAAVTARHPLRERLAGQYLRSLAGAGRRAEALRAYDRVVGDMEAELGVGPGPELRRLHRQIRLGDPDVLAVGGEGRSPVPALPCCPRPSRT